MPSPVCNSGTLAAKFSAMPLYHRMDRNQDRRRNATTGLTTAAKRSKLLLAGECAFATQGASPRSAQQRRAGGSI
jgi:hypothetical protein